MKRQELEPHPRLYFGLSVTGREGIAPAGPRATGHVDWHERRGRSLAPVL